MKSPKGLGRGLDAIFGTEGLDLKAKPMSEMTEIEIGKIIPNPTQPRKEFDEEALDELADSIRQLGVIQPVTVRKAEEGRYIIISGERRWRAAQRADLKTLPVYIREVDDEDLHAMALVENIQRQDLNAIEIALGMQRLLDECHLTQDALSEKVGKKRSSVANYLRLLKLPESYSRLVERLEQLFTSEIAIKRTKNGGGRITIDFADDAEVERIIERLKER